MRLGQSGLFPAMLLSTGFIIGLVWSRYLNKLRSLDRRGQLNSSSAGTCRNKGNRKLFKKSEEIRVFCAGSLQEYQDIISSVVERDDVVLEVGCSAGGTTKALQARTDLGRVVTIDVERKDFATPRGDSEMPDCVIDPFSIHLMLGLEVAPTTIFLDLSSVLGRDGTLDGIALIRQFSRTFSSLQTIVVKSRALRNHASQFHDAATITQQWLRQSEKPQVPAQLGRVLWLPDRWSGPNGVRVFCAVGVSEYRKTIQWLIQKADNVLEIGCQAGLTTAMIKKQADAGHVLGVDVGRKSVEHARQQHPNVQFEVADGWDTHELMRLSGGTHAEASGWNVIYVDVSGISGRGSLMDALGLMQQLCNAHHKSLRAIVVKSRCLRDHANAFLEAKVSVGRQAKAETPQP